MYSYAHLTTSYQIAKGQLLRGLALLRRGRPLAKEAKKWITLMGSPALPAPREAFEQVISPQPWTDRRVCLYCATFESLSADKGGKIYGFLSFRIGRSGHRQQ